MNLIKITKIKKGLVLFNDVNTEVVNSQGMEEEPLKCPKCNLVHLITSEDREKFEEVIGVDHIKERVKKRNEVKLQNLYKNAESESPEVQLRNNV